jgi:hypothetical protein
VQKSGGTNMTKKETSTIRGQMGMLKTALQQMRAEKDNAIEEGDWNEVNYWEGRIEQINETLDFLNELTGWIFYK